MKNHLEFMSIYIEKDDETPDFVDYFFVCDESGPDPSHKNRRMIISQKRGLFRIQKYNEEPLLFPMEGDTNNERFLRAATKVLKDYKLTKLYPEKSHFASG